MTAKSKLAIFDIDGTLTDSVPVHQTAFVEALHAFGVKQFDSNWAGYKHHTDSYIFKTIVETELKRPLKPEDLLRFEELLYQLILEAVRQQPLQEIKGAQKFISLLEMDEEFDVMYATGSFLRPALLKLEQIGIVAKPDTVIAANLLYEREDLIRKAVETAKELYGKSNFAQIIAFGDGIWDYQAAQNTDIDFVGIQNLKLLELPIAHFFADFNDAALLEAFQISEKSPQLPNFVLLPKGEISAAFLSRDILTFHQAIDYILHLPYGRNANKNDLTTLFSDQCGTCSTKHAVLKLLADENNFEGLDLMCGLFKMNAQNTAPVKGVLAEHGLDYLPEAHNYLRYEGQRYDFTLPTKIDFVEDLLLEIVLQPDQIGAFKVAYHRNYMEKWLNEQPNLQLSLEELWGIREQCIEALAEV